MTGDPPKGPVIVHYRSNNYNVTDFIEKHPGGPEVLWLSMGKDIDDVFAGKEKVDGVCHKHSDAALKLLNKMQLNKQTEKDLKFVSA